MWGGGREELVVSHKAENTENCAYCAQGVDGRKRIPNGWVQADDTGTKCAYPSKKWLGVSFFGDEGLHERDIPATDKYLCIDIRIPHISSKNSIHDDKCYTGEIPSLMGAEANCSLTPYENGAEYKSDRNKIKSV